MVTWDGGGYSVLSWRVFRVNVDTWADGPLLTRVNSASVSRDVSDTPTTIERGSMSVDMAVADSFEEGYYRIVMTASQGGSTERVDVATLLFTSVSSTVSRGVSEAQLSGRSVLYPASVTRLAAGSYAPKGVDGAAFCKELLDGCINAPVLNEGSFTLDDHVVFDMGASVLDCVWMVLDAGNHVLQIGGDGIVHVRPKPTAPSLVLDTAHARLLHPESGHDLDYSEVPNRYIAVMDNATATAVNSDPTSVTSTVYRGWTSDIVDQSPVRTDGETLAAYAARRLEEESMVTDERTYTREWWPDVMPFSLVYGSLSSVGIEGDFRVVSQQLTCGSGIVVEERASREVYAWRRT